MPDPPQKLKTPRGSARRRRAARGLVVLLGGAPTSGKSSLAKRLADRFDAVVELDFQFDVAFGDWMAALPHLLPPASHSIPAPRAGRIVVPGARGDASPETWWRLKFALAAKAVHDIVRTARADGRAVLVEGWMLAPGYVVPGPDVVLLQTAIARTELRKRLRAPPDPLDPARVARVLALDALLARLAKANGTARLPPARLEKLIARRLAARDGRNG